MIKIIAAALAAAFFITGCSAELSVRSSSTAQVSESVPQEVQQKYGGLCRSIANSILGKYIRTVLR